MPDPQDQEPKRTPRHALRAMAGLLLFFGLVGIAIWQLIVHPSTPLPDQWNPSKPLVVAEPVTWITPGKLRRALRNPQTCLAALPDPPDVLPLDPFEASDQCNIRNRVELRTLGSARIGPIETSCAIALRTAMWERHSVQPAAAHLLNSNVAAIREIGSYNCRAIRTPNGSSNRMSTHATAEAIDITGFILGDGRRVILKNHWESVEFGDFLKAVRDGACKWYATTLGPDYNSLHADHFHLQARGWGTCR